MVFTEEQIQLATDKHCIIRGVRQIITVYDGVCERGFCRIGDIKQGLLPPTLAHRAAKMQNRDKYAGLPPKLGCVNLCRYTKRRRAVKLHLRSALKWGLNCDLGPYFFLMRT